MFLATARPPTSVITMETRQSAVSQLSTVDQVNFPHPLPQSLPWRQDSLLSPSSQLWTRKTFPTPYLSHHHGDKTVCCFPALNCGPGKLSPPPTSVITMETRQSAVSQLSTVDQVNFPHPLPQSLPWRQDSLLSPSSQLWTR